VIPIELIKTMNKPLKKIVAECKQGNRLAQRQLYERTKDKLFVLCLRYTNNRADAEDILQEGFITIFKCLHQYRGEGSLEGWMRKVVLRVALAFVRKEKRTFSKVPLNENHQEIELNLNRESNAGHLIRMMGKLPLGYRTVLNLYVLEGYSHEEIAEALGISIGTSKSQLNRAKAKMRMLLEKNLSS